MFTSFLLVIISWLLSVWKMSCSCLLAVIIWLLAVINCYEHTIIYWDRGYDAHYSPALLLAYLYLPLVSLAE